MRSPTLTTGLRQCSEPGILSYHLPPLEGADSNMTSLQALIPRLIERTRSGKLAWTPLPTEGESAYVHQLPEGAGSVVVRRQYSTYQLAVFNSHGAQLESVGEMQQVREVQALWDAVESRRQASADPLVALEKDLRG
jgi:hypothetical protein